jgi:hypothetical protein
LISNDPIFIGSKKILQFWLDILLLSPKKHQPQSLKDLFDLTFPKFSKRIKRLHSRIFGARDQKPESQQSGPQNSLDLSDSDLIRKAKQAKNGDAFSRLWSGDWSGYDSQEHIDAVMRAVRNTERCAFTAFSDLATARYNLNAAALGQYTVQQRLIFLFQIAIPQITKRNIGIGYLSVYIRGARAALVAALSALFFWINSATAGEYV